MKPETPYPTISIRDTNLVSLPLAGQTAQLEFIGKTDLNFSILPFTSVKREQPDLLYIQMAFSRSAILLPNPATGYVPIWSLVEEGGRIIVDKRRVTRRMSGKLVDKVDVKVDGTKAHVLTIECPSSELRRILGISKPYFNPSLNLSVAHGGKKSRGPFETLPL